MNLKEYLATNQRPSKSKFGNIKTDYNGTVFHSKKEANYAKLLDSLKHARNPKEKISSYEMQVPYPIVFNGEKICKYIADFKVKYMDGREEVIDVKGVKTDIYRIKKKLVKAQYGIEIKEV